MESLDEPPDGDKNISPALLRDWREIPSEALEREEVRRLLEQAIEALPDTYRQVFLLRDVEDLNSNETAQLPVGFSERLHVRLDLEFRRAET